MSGGKGSGLGMVNLCGGGRVAEWMRHNIWRKKERSGLASARCRLYPYSEILILVRFHRVLSTSSILRGLASKGKKTQTRKITSKTCKTGMGNQSEGNDPRWVSPIK
jgi:hypothetical protein